MPGDSYLCCGDDPAGIVSGCRSSHAEAIARPDDGWASVTGRDQGYSPLLTLRSGATLTLAWQAQPGMMVADSTKGLHSCPNMKDIRANPVLGPILEHYGTRTYANGRLTYAPDFAKPGDVADIVLSGAEAEAGALTAHGSGSALFKLDSPYPYAAATLTATSSGGSCAFALSGDGGASWTPCAPGDLTALVRQRYALWLKATFTGALTALAVDAVVEHNRGALPFLYPGANVVTVGRRGAVLPAGEALVVTYAFQEATAPAHRSSFNGAEVTYGEARTVTREATALPCTFTIDVGGTTPPRMLSISRALKALPANVH